MCRALFCIVVFANMASNIPTFTGPRRSVSNVLLGDLPRFTWNEISEKEEIGRGGFGCVFTAKRCDGEMVVVKKLLRHHEREKRLFLKEARILNSLRNEHVVALKAVCETPLAMMLQYVYFTTSRLSVSKGA